MSSIHGQPPGHQPSPQSDAEAEPAPRPAPRPPPTPIRPAREAADALQTGAARPPMAAHAQTERLLQPPFRAPLPAAPQARHAQTTPLAPAARPAADGQAAAARVEAMVITGVPFAQLAPEGRALAADLSRLTRHVEGLKAYFFVAPGAPALVAGHGAVDVVDFDRGRSPVGAANLGATADGCAKREVASHRELNVALRAKVNAWGDADAGALTQRAVAKALIVAGLKGGQLLAPVAPGGEPAVQGGTRLCRDVDGARVSLQPSGVYGYVDGGAEVREQLANYYANALLAEAQANGVRAPRVTAKPQRTDHLQLTAEAMNAGLSALATQINAKLDTHEATLG